MNLPAELLNPIAIQRAIGKISFYEFVKMCWHIVSPDSEFLNGIHIDAICQHLQATKDGQIRNLLMNIPLRHSKSILSDVFYPAWCWTWKPSKKILLASYGSRLTTEMMAKFKLLVMSEYYQERWPIGIAKNQEIMIRNLKNGYYKCFGTGSAITGDEGDILIVDDPLDSQYARSEVEREKVNSWYDDTFSNRVANPHTVVKIIIMQRLHMADLSSHVLEKGQKWEHLVLPAEYEGEKNLASSIGYRDPRVTIGQPLWPERYGTEELHELQKGMSKLAISGQFQQRPSNIDGNCFLREFFSERSENYSLALRIISVDPAISERKTADYSAIVVGEITHDYRLFIRHIRRGQWGLPELQDQLEQVARFYKAGLQHIVVESKASGQSLVQTMRKTSEPWIADMLWSYDPKGEKEFRAAQASVFCENGSVFLPPHSDAFPWLHEFENELFNFGTAPHDDMVDAFDQLILFADNYLTAGFQERIKKR
jgi:predicted phage terminase large subunit-like protein